MTLFSDSPCNQLSSVKSFLFNRELGSVRLTVLVEDRMRVTARTIKSNYKSYSGDKIGLGQLASQHQAWNKKYILSFFQHKFSEDDKERESEIISYRANQKTGSRYRGLN